MEVDPPRFDGTMKKDIDDWISETEDALKGIDCPEDWKVPVAQNLLRDAAARWWRTCRPRELVVTWKEFTEFLREEYCPEPIRKARAREFMEAERQGSSVLDIVRQYQLELSYVVDMVSTERQKICHLEQRLPADVRQYASGFLCSTLREYQNVVLAYALTLPKREGSNAERGRHTETMSKRPRQENDETHRSKAVLANSDGSGSSRIATSVTGGRRCYNCKSLFHLMNNCPKRPSRCYMCNSIGHVDEFCPRRGRE